MSVEHATFVLERRYDAAPQRVFAAWAEPAAKARWFGGAKDHFELDFRVGGRELHRGTDPRGRRYTFQALYQDIVPDQRIIYTYDMLLGETRISVSMAIVELKPDGGGTQLVLTEHGAFLDGHDTVMERRSGMGTLLDALREEFTP